MSLYEQFGKRLGDILLSVVIIVLVSPVYFLASVFIYFDSGFPIFYTQCRVGKYAKDFNVFKFRTMVVNADKLGPTRTLIGDQRITRLGSILRKLSIDELPQLFNVLAGDMSLIGYRPGVRENYESSFLSSKVFNTRPGITGLAQITGRSNLTSEVKRDLELEYVDNISFSGDFKILFSTVYKVFLGRNAF